MMCRHSELGSQVVRAQAMLAAAFITLIVLAPARAALVDGGEEDFTAVDFVEQAIGLLQGQPEMADLIEDRIADALEDDEVEGVDLVLVAEAQEAFEEGGASETLELLARSIDEEIGLPCTSRRWEEASRRPRERRVQS